MFQHKKIITAVEIGTSKICVLVGESNTDGKLTVIGRAESPSDNSVCKGEICDMQKATDILINVLAEADESCRRQINNSDIIVMTITSSNISSHQGVGTVFINSEDRRITVDELAEAENNAMITQLPIERAKINTIPSYFMIDGATRVRNPVDLIANKMEAVVHIIHGDSNRLSNFKVVMRDAGFDNDLEMVFSGLSVAYGVLTEEEQEQGVLLVDMGAGTTEYIAIFNQGALASGVIPIGFDHVANDLSIGLDLPISNCRKMLSDGSIASHIKERHGSIELRTNNGKIRKIPMSSIEKIIDLRLKETFQIIHQKIKDLAIMNNLGAGGIISGGAALFPRTAEIFRTTFDFPVRIGQPFEAAGAVTGIEDPRYSNIWGGLRFGLACLINNSGQEKRGLINYIVSGIDRMAGSMWKRIRDAKGAIKI